MENREIMGGFRTINPATQETIQEYHYMTHEEASKAVEDCHHAFLDWKTKSPDNRASIIKKIGETDLASLNYSKSLELNPQNNNAKHKLKELQKSE